MRMRIESGSDIDKENARKIVRSVDKQYIALL